MAVRTAIDDLLEQEVESGRVPGVAAFAADESGEIYAGAFGKRELGGDTPMTLDTVVWIASMTKAVTSVAAMQQVERGSLDLDAPISNVLPQLANPQVLEGWDSSGAPKLRPARRPITLRHLLTHTAGFSYDNWNGDIGRYQKYAGIPGLSSGLNVALTTPLVFDPGDRWEYGINIDWAGKAVEAVTGLDLEAYFKEHIFRPLGMASSGFVLTPDARSRLASLHARTGDTSFTASYVETNQSPEFYMGGGGLFSTGRDYLAFLQALLRGGTYNGAQILRPETVAEMGRNQIGDIRVQLMKSFNAANSNDAEFYPGMPKTWGLGYMRIEEDAPTGRSAGSLSWAGLRNTYYWLDPTKRVAGVILTQVLPFADPIVLDLFGRFERAVYDSRA